MQKIIRERGRGSTGEFLVRWKGFGQEEDSWLRREELTGACVREVGKASTP